MCVLRIQGDRLVSVSVNGVICLHVTAGWFYIFRIELVCVVFGDEQDEKICDPNLV